MKVKITELHPNSIWNGTENVVNNVFELENKALFPSNDGWCFVTPKDERFGGNHVWCKFVEVPEPSAMSELGTTIHLEKKRPIRVADSVKLVGVAVNKVAEHTKEAIKEYGELNKTLDSFNKAVYPKKPTWIQKIRGYDDVVRQRNQFHSMSSDLYSRCAAAEAMRDHYGAVCKTQCEVIKDRTRDVNYYESIATEKSRELKLIEKVADCWQDKLIKANERISDNEEIVKERDWYCSELARSVSEMIDVNKTIEEYNKIEEIIIGMHEYSDGQLSIPEIIEDLRKRITKLINEVVDFNIRNDNLRIAIRNIAHANEYSDHSMNYEQIISYAKSIYKGNVE